MIIFVFALFVDACYDIIAWRDYRIGLFAMRRQCDLCPKDACDAIYLYFVFFLYRNGCFNCILLDIHM